MIPARPDLEAQETLAHIIVGLEACAAERWAKAGTLTGSAAETMRRNARDIADLADQLRGDLAGMLQTPAALIAVAAE